MAFARLSYRSATYAALRFVAVCYSVTRLSCAKTAKRIEVLFGMDTLRDPRNIVLDEILDPPTTRERVGANFAHCKVHL